jgi:hypothetical protein
MRPNENSHPLAVLWALATMRSLHGAFCTCAGGGPSRLTSTELEQHITDFLIDKYRTEPALLDALAERKAEPRSSFVAWLSEFGPARIPPPLLAAVRDDIRDVCLSIADPGGNFSCT